MFAVVQILFLVSVAAGEELFASMKDGQRLATRIHCQTDESEHFVYQSTADLWGTKGGRILISADLSFHCLGADDNGKYGKEALKYNVEISNLNMAEESDGRSRRKKRGAKDFFQNSWQKVKKFFNKVFGRKTTEETTRHSVVEDEIIDTEPEEVFSVHELSSVYSTPFQLVQLANGSIPEIRFSENEVDDGRVKNFKRHLADAFATQLGLSSQRTLETSVMGEHTSVYDITVTGEKANLNVAGWSSTAGPEDGAKVVVKKVVTEDDIVNLAPSEALNDKNNMDLETHQTQVFQDGRMISSSGTSSLLLVAEDKAGGKRRKKRAEEGGEDATSYIHAHTSFDVQLRRRHRRSAEESIRLQGENFHPESRTAQVDVGAEERNKLRNLQDSVDLKNILEDVTEDRRTEKMQILFEIVEREVSLKLDEEKNSMAVTIRTTFTEERMQQLCSKNFTTCKDYLQLIALAGGPTAEKIFLHFLREVNERYTASQIQLVVDILSDIPKPSTNLVNEIASILNGQNMSSEVSGALCLALTNLASKSTAEAKSNASRFLSRKLLVSDCNRDPVVIDLLEAVGNLKGDQMVTNVLQVSSSCKGNGAIQIACAHALRHSSHLATVQTWIEEMLSNGDCDVFKEVVGSLMDKIQDQEITADASVWPRSHFNQIDELLKKHLKDGICSTEDILLYFSRKRNAEANSIAQNHFVPESEPWEPSSNSRQKRSAPWDDLNCREWTEDRHFTPIQDKNEFTSDRSTYNRRKSCLAFRKLGVKGANAEIYAGMFAGVKEPSDPPKYKLFAKFVSGVNFLGNQVEIGSFYFYLHSGGKTRAFVRIMGRTRQEFTNDACTPTELRYRPLKHIPLYLLSVANVQLSLGIHLSSRLSVDTECPEEDIYQLQPLTDVRIGGEAMGTLLFIRGAANLGADFNYKLQFTFTPSPNMCLRGSHGFDPMSINFESYFQLWNAAKDDWGKMRMWKPNFMSWQVRKGQMKQWFDDTCIVTQERDSAPPGIERELEK